MQFVAEHTFANVGLGAFERRYFDEAFNVALCQSVQMQRTVLQLTRSGANLHRAVQIYPQRALPAPLRKLMGAERLGYVEHVDYTFGSHVVHWRIEPSVLPDKVKSFGSVTFSADGQGGVRRVVRGEVNVKIFGLGGTIERFIVADVQKSYTDAATFTAAHLAAHPAT